MTDSYGHPGKHRGDTRLELVHRTTIRPGVETAVYALGIRGEPRPWRFQAEARWFTPDGGIVSDAVVVDELARAKAIAGRAEQLLRAGTTPDLRGLNLAIR